MTTLILSDTHLWPRFNPKKLEYLLKVVDSADEVIINGDFWDGWFWTFDDFLNSSWQPLLNSLSQKYTLYITGNHDHISKVDDRALQFCQWYGEQCMTELPNGISVLFTHGHIMKPTLEQRHWVFDRYYLKQFGSASNRVQKRLYGQLWLQDGNPINRPLKQWQSINLESDVWFACGHTHYPEIDTEHQFLNTGFTFAGYTSYLLTDEQGIRLIKARY